LAFRHQERPFRSDETVLADNALTTPTNLDVITQCASSLFRLISHGPNQWERTIFDPPPQLGDPRSIFRKLEIYNYFPDTTSHAKKISGEYVDVGGLGK